MTRVIGLTGNIASGKSTVAALFAARGATVIDADELARDAVAVGTPALADIARRWPQVISADRSLDRAALRHIVFADPAALEALNAIVHPDVARRRDELISAARLYGIPVVVYNVPLLFETGADHTVDAVVLVDAPIDVRRARLVRERGLSPAVADAMIASQMPAALKRARATYVIDNDRDHTTLTARADAVWNALANAAAAG